MELRGQTAEVFVSGPNGDAATAVVLSGTRASVGRLPELNDIGLQPDPQRVVSRAGHCTFEREGRVWFVVDGGSVNGTFLRRGNELQRVAGRTALRDGDVVCILAEVDEGGERRFFELIFHAEQDSQATRAPRPLRRTRASATTQTRRAWSSYTAESGVRSRFAPRRTGWSATWRSARRRSARTTS